VISRERGIGVPIGHLRLPLEVDVDFASNLDERGQFIIFQLEGSK
jgi:hypothetical protein